FALAAQRANLADESDIALAESFCHQAVIAIENTRLFNETNQALARQTAQAEILNVIAGSPTDVNPAFDAIVRAARRVVRCDEAFFLLCRGNTYHVVTMTARGGPVSTAGKPSPIDPAANFPSRAIVTKQTVYYPDWSLIEVPEHEREVQRRFGTNSSL